MKPISPKDTITIDTFMHYLRAYEYQQKAKQAILDSAIGTTALPLTTYFGIQLANNLQNFAQTRELESLCTIAICGLATLASATLNTYGLYQAVNYLKYRTASARQEALGQRMALDDKGTLAIERLLIYEHLGEKL